MQVADIAVIFALQDRVNSVLRSLHAAIVKTLSTYGDKQCVQKYVEDICEQQAVLEGTTNVTLTGAILSIAE
jgi:hypothetical protein